jgi:hypothetical protein
MDEEEDSGEQCELELESKPNWNWVRDFASERESKARRFCL